MCKSAVEMNHGFLKAFAIFKEMPSDPKALDEAQLAIFHELGIATDAFGESLARKDAEDDLKRETTRLYQHVASKSAQFLGTVYEPMEKLAIQRFIHIKFPECYKGDNVHSVLPTRDAEGNPTNETIGKCIGKEVVSLLKFAQVAKLFGKRGAIQATQAMATLSEARLLATHLQACSG